MDEMVEKVAKALFEISAEPEHGDTWEAVAGKPFGDFYRRHARAAIHAMRQPSFGRTGNDASLADKLKLAANNVEMARRDACVEHLAGWEHGIIRSAVDALGGGA